jgi:hypothetical protein
LVKSRADIVSLQEVRLDGAFASLTRSIPHWRNPEQSKHDGGSQIEHLLSHITAARFRLNISDSWEYQVVYQPAMSMWDK